MSFRDVGRALIRSTAGRLRPARTGTGTGAVSQSQPPAVQVVVDTSRAPDLAKWAADAQELVVQWFPRICELLAGERFRPPKKVKLVFKRELDHPAHTSGVWVKAITISAAWIRKHPDDVGLVIHELTHVIQSYPSSDAMWLVEGIADYVRYVCFERKTRAPRPAADASYRDGYKTTAFFLRWLEMNHDPQIVARLNRDLRRRAYSEDLFEEYTGQTLDGLWSAYVAGRRHRISR